MSSSLRKTKLPRIVESKFACNCAETGRPIGKGEKSLYYPESGKLYKIGTKQHQDWLTDPAYNQVDPLPVDPVWDDAISREGDDFRRTAIAGGYRG